MNTKPAVARPMHPSDADTRIRKRLCAAIALVGFGLALFAPPLSGKVIGLALFGTGLIHYHWRRWYPIDLRLVGDALVLQNEHGRFEKPVSDLVSVIEWSGYEGKAIDFTFRDGSRWSVPQYLGMRPLLREWVERSLAAAGLAEVRIEERPWVFRDGTVQRGAEASDEGRLAGTRPAHSIGKSL